MISFRCPSCGQVMQIDDRAGGSTVACISCRNQMVVPAAPTAPHPPPQAYAPGSPPQYYAPQPARQGSGGRGLGIASFILGLIASGCGIVPMFGFCIGWVLAPIGLLLGFIGLIVGLASKGRGALASLLGCLVCLGAFTVPFWAPQMLGIDLGEPWREFLKEFDIETSGGSKIDQAEAAIRYDGPLASALDDYNVDTATYPTTGQGLEALYSQPWGLRGWSGPYLDDRSLMTDPWNRPYKYAYPGSHNFGSYDLSSAGPDGVHGTSDDITNW